MAAATEANNSSSSSGGMGAMEDWRKKSGLSCSFFIFAALNLAMVIVGGDAVYLCKIQPMIPIYLIGKYKYITYYSLYTISCISNMFDCMLYILHILYNM